MGRSNGEFPRYNKISLDAETWPYGYWDNSRLCRICEIHWPDQLPHFDNCPVCRGKTSLTTSSPDMRWPEAVKAVKQASFEAAYEVWNEGASDQDLLYDAEAIRESVDRLIAEVDN